MGLTVNRVSPGNKVPWTQKQILDHITLYPKMIHFCLQEGCKLSLLMKLFIHFAWYHHKGLKSTFLNYKVVVFVWCQQCAYFLSFFAPYRFSLLLFLSYVSTCILNLYSSVQYLSDSFIHVNVREASTTKVGGNRLELKLFS